MKEIKYVFGPVPSRRLGRSLGISPIPKKTCNYSCIYCQLGRTDRMTAERREFFPVEDILAEAESYLKNVGSFDVVSIVGEGEPTLYLKLGELIKGLKKRTDKPIAVITNGALMYDPQVRRELCEADIVLPSMDGFDEESYKRIDRPVGSLHYDKVLEGLKAFTHEFKGQIYMEIMLIDGINDDRASLEKFKKDLSMLRYDRLYINTPVRPPAEKNVHVSSDENLKLAADMLGGISIETLAGGSFFSEIPDDYEAVLGIIGRHPMNQHEIAGFLSSRDNKEPEKLFDRLKNDEKVVCTEYKGYYTFRLK